MDFLEVRAALHIRHALDLRVFEKIKCLQIRAVSKGRCDINHRDVFVAIFSPVYFGDYKESNAFVSEVCRNDALRSGIIKLVAPIAQVLIRPRRSRRQYREQKRHRHPFRCCGHGHRPSQNHSNGVGFLIERCSNIRMLHIL